MISNKIKCLNKLITTIDKATLSKDLPKIVEDYEKYNKILRKENAQIQKDLQKQL